MTRIPQVGDAILVVVRAADKDLREPMDVRPATITKVHNYAVGNMCVDAQLTSNGIEDSEIMKDLSPKTTNNMDLARQPIVKINALMYSKEQQFGTFHFPSEMYHMIGNIEVAKTISHGRERIRTGAVGVWDQAKDTITFNREDVSGLAENQDATYPARQFMDWHVARLIPPEGIVMISVMRERRDTNEESPDERHQILREMKERRDAGLPSGFTGPTRMPDAFIQNASQAMDMFEHMRNLAERFFEDLSSGQFRQHSQRMDMPGRGQHRQRTTSDQRPSITRQTEQREEAKVGADA